MNTGPHIVYLKRQEIDTTRWDNCIRQASNGLIYGYHHYLDQMTGCRWDGLVLEDYQAVMPLTWRRKFGIAYLYQPAFMPQTGIFSPSPISPGMIDAFLQVAGRHFSFAEIFLNYGNAHPALQTHTNFILPLDAAYDRLAGHYKENLVRNLRRAASHSLVYVKDADLDKALDTWFGMHGHKNRNTGRDTHRRFQRLCRWMQQEEKLLVRAVTDHRQQWLATAVLLRDPGRLYFLQSTALPAGRPMAANHFLVDQLIREWAGNPLILDFEGSDTPGIARFYASFGSTDQPYFFWRINRLPWPFRLLKAATPAIDRQTPGRQAK